jgi:hypothetical protein
MEFFIKICLAHVLADFVFQPNHWVKHKEQQTYRSPYLYVHVILYYLLTMLMLGFESKDWIPALVVAISHGLIDTLKCILNRLWHRKSSVDTPKIHYPIYSFLIDQFLHLAILIVWAFGFETQEWSHWFPLPANTWMWLLCMVLLTQVGSVLIRIMVARWIPQVPTPEWTLQNAGTYIGMLERLMVFAFIVTGHWEGIGFLIAAKSVLRYGDLKEVHDRRLTEYVLIGTLLSFGWALAIGLFYLEVIKLLA